jgi:hypothetical protein
MYGAFGPALSWLKNVSRRGIATFFPPIAAISPAMFCGTSQP